MSGFVTNGPPIPYPDRVSLGLVAGTVVLNKFGHGILAGGTAEALWDGSNLAGITGYPYMSGSNTLYISSDDAGDDQVYEVQGLDATGVTQTVNVTADGVAFVALSGTWNAVFRVRNMGATDGAGNIYVSNDNTDVGGNGIPDTITAVKAMIIAGNNQTLMAVYRVPLGKSFLLHQWHCSMGKGDDSEMTLRVRFTGGVFQVKDHQDIYQEIILREYDPPLKIDALSDVEVCGLIGAGGGDASAGFDGFLVTE